MNEWSFFCANGGNQSWQVWVSLRGNTKMAESKMAKIQNGRIQDGCHHQVKWEWMSLSQIELVWVRVRVAWECFWVNLREDNKVSKSKMAVLHSNMEEFKMAAIIKLSQNEWVKFFFVQNGWNQDGRIIDVWHHQVESEWMSVFFFFVRNGWIQDGSIQDDCHHKVGSEWMSEVFFCSKWLNPRWQISRWLTSSS